MAFGQVRCVLFIGKLCLGRKLLKHDSLDLASDSPSCAFWVFMVFVYSVQHMNLSVFKSALPFLYLYQKTLLEL